MVNQERMLAQLCIHRPPPDILARRRLIDNSLILGRPTRLLSRRCHQRSSTRDNRPVLVSQRILVQLCDRRVTVHEDVVVINPGIVVEQFWVWVVGLVVDTRVRLLWVMAVVVALVGVVGVGGAVGVVAGGGVSRRGGGLDTTQR